MNAFAGDSEGAGEQAEDAPVQSGRLHWRPRPCRLHCAATPDRCYPQRRGRENSQPGGGSRRAGGAGGEPRGPATHRERHLPRR